MLSGMLAKFRTDRAGSRQIIGVSLPRDVILPHNEIRLYGQQALVKCRLILVPKQSLDRAVRQSDDLRQYLWRAILRDEAINHERILNLARRDAASRVAHLFCEFRERGGLAEPNAGLPLTQQQIASITGQTPINVNRIMRDFQRAGYLTRERSRVSVLDWSGLEQVASFNCARPRSGWSRSSPSAASGRCSSHLKTRASSRSTVLQAREWRPARRLC